MSLKSSQDSEIYKKYNLKVGLEIHFQLNTGRKLFCHCPIGLKSNVEGYEFIRKLRPTQSELGQVDPAAYFEFQKGTIINYISPLEYTCLVEADEEPPHDICEDAIKVALKVARYLKALIIDEIHVMRKIVIDGSNPTGFQRTAIIGLGGEIYVKNINKKVPIQSICLEEEAARLIERKGNSVKYYLDRLGIPLIEISTAPVINTPEEAIEVATALCRVVTATGLRRRGIGTIRQDINISVLGGEPVEIKGVQKLPQLAKVIRFEFKRQLGLIELAKELQRRGITENDIINSCIIDATDIFKDSECKIIRRVIRSGGKVYAIKLKGFGGLIGKEIAENHRLGKEFSERVRFWSGLGGIFHSDELPAYGISMDEIKRLVRMLDMDEKYDAFIIVAGSENQVRVAIEKIIERAIEALKGVPSETRGAREDGSTFYMRPRPGMARMYPETDIPPIYISKELIKEIDENPLPDPEEVISNLISQYNLNRELALKIYDSDYFDLFKRLASIVKKIDYKYLASLLTDRLSELESEGIDTSLIDDKMLYEVIKAVENGLIEKEAILEVLKYSIKNNVSILDSINALSLKLIKIIK